MWFFSWNQNIRSLRGFQAPKLLISLPNYWRELLKWVAFPEFLILVFSLLMLIIYGACFTLQTHLSSCPDKEKGAQERLVEPLLSLVKSYEGGRESHAHIIVKTYNNLWYIVFLHYYISSWNLYLVFFFCLFIPMYKWLVYDATKSKPGTK